VSSNIANSDKLACGVKEKKAHEHKDITLNKQRLRDYPSDDARLHKCVQERYKVIISISWSVLDIVKIWTVVCVS